MISIPKMKMSATLAIPRTRKIDIALPDNVNLGSIEVQEGRSATITETETLKKKTRFSRIDWRWWKIPEEERTKALRTKTVT
jgi:hypothetical protein